MSETLKQVQKVAQHLTENKAENVLILDVEDNFQIASYFVLATGQSRPHLDFLRKETKQFFEDELDREQSSWEGSADQGWMLSDYEDIIVHLFTEKKRAYYDLEGLWADADVVTA